MFPVIVYFRRNNRLLNDFIMKLKRELVKPSNHNKGIIKMNKRAHTT